MAKFVFELESLLEQRRRVERDWMRKVGEIEAERVEIEASAAALARAFVDEQLALRGQLSAAGGVDLGSVRLQSNAALHGLRRRHELALRGAATLKRLDAARKGLLDATTSRRAVELLRERRHEAWLVAERRREARETDELVTSRHKRESHGAGPAPVRTEDRVRRLEGGTP